MLRIVLRCLMALSAIVASILPAAAYADAAHPVVALLPGVTDPFYFTMYRGAQRAAKEENVQLLFQVPKAWNTTEQVPILKAFIAKHPDVLLVSPVDKQQMIGPLKEAADAGIKVVTVDTYIGDGHYQTGKGDADFPLSYIASDNLEGGRVAARALAKAVGDKGTVYCENNKPGISSTDARAQGFMEEMKKHPNIKVLETQYNEDDANRAAAHVAAVLARNPDLAGVFGANTFSGSGAAQGVKAAGRQGQVKVVVFDAVPGIDEQIRSGLVDIAIAQRPDEIGYYGVKFAADAIRGKPVPTIKSTGFVVLDRSNIDKPETKQYIYSN
ncbi:substrate-binding domain-containing protein [Paraburkholderia sp. MMS20-SJTN17]|uniref:Substrate-binding domain-containing protein n=1 Tax=Paraburkholderia translucens TaxID=2886945 RepID=A0ABS8KC55_9BURK|nr:ABC transporter substrate-binding protein [Paraburkholderia sp. MMS20-SJTN17]MCC8402349.1 substrate-binding domain-containing protein [Paraburkholderia sp. MMS20-SJTN17]